MMSHYEVRVRETFMSTYRVEAEGPVEAREKAYDMRDEYEIEQDAAVVRSMVGWQIVDVTPSVSE